MLASACFVIASLCLQQSAAAAAPKNLLTGVAGPVTSDLYPPFQSALTSWAGVSVLDLIPGAGLFPITSAKTVLYLGFTAGTTADVGNMVIYQTARGSPTITNVKSVKWGGVSNPSINITSCLYPCTIRLDPTALALSPLSDYYFVVFFKNDPNNQVIGGVEGSKVLSLLGFYEEGDATQRTVGESVPGVGPANTENYTHYVDFLMYVMTN